MADGYARSTGRPGVLCVVPGPGRHQRADRPRRGAARQRADRRASSATSPTAPSTARSRSTASTRPPCLQPVTKGVFAVQHVGEIPGAVRQAFQLADGGEPGPVGVVIPYNLLIEAARFDSPPLAPPGAAVRRGRRRTRRVAAARRPPAQASASTPASAAWTTRRRWCGSPSCCRPRWRPASRGKGVIPESAPAGRRLGLRAAGDADGRGRVQARRLRAGHRRQVQRGLDRLLRAAAARGT